MKIMTIQQERRIEDAHIHGAGAGSGCDEILELRWNVTGRRSARYDNCGVDICRYVARLINADDARRFRWRNTRYLAVHICFDKSLIVRTDRIIIGLAVCNRCVDERMLQSRVIAKIKICPVHANRMQSGYAVDEIELRNRYPECRRAECIGYRLVFDKVRLGTPIDAVTFEIILLVKCVERFFRAVIPIESHFAVARNRLNHRLIRRFGKLVVSIVDLLDGFLPQKELVGIESEDQPHRKTLSRAGLLRLSGCYAVGAAAVKVKQIAGEVIRQIYTGKRLPVRLRQLCKGGPVALVVIKIVGMNCGNEKSRQAELIGLVFIENTEVRFALLRLAVALAAVLIGTGITGVERTNAIAANVVVQRFTRIPFAVVIEISKGAPVAVLVCVPMRLPGISIECMELRRIGLDVAN